MVLGLTWRPPYAPVPRSTMKRHPFKTVLVLNKNDGKGVVSFGACQRLLDFPCSTIVHSASHTYTVTTA